MAETARVLPLVPDRYNPENIFGRNIVGFGLAVFVVFTTAIAVTLGEPPAPTGIPRPTGFAS